MQIKVHPNDKKTKYIITPSNEADYMPDSAPFLKKFKTDLNYGIAIYIITRILGILIFFGGIAIAIILLIHEYYIYIWSGLVFSLFSCFCFSNKTTNYKHGKRILYYYEDDLKRFYFVKKRVKEGGDEKNWKDVSYEFTPNLGNDGEIVRVLENKGEFRNGGDEQVITIENNDFKDDKGNVRKFKVFEENKLGNGENGDIRKDFEKK